MLDIKILHYLFLCHRLPERSFFIKGRQFPICARCTGILVGYFGGLCYILINRNMNLGYEILLMIPIAVDGLGQFYGLWMSNNLRRFITGLLAGVSTICIFKSAVYLGISHGAQIGNWLFR